ncbi:hypothetical protein FGIG_12032 [Fasciola gigantica]|uniref:Uncharacterized protein n=1 Tax=Fasciola gigantica TaxID=46835 RepID=A0A504Y6L0_FASGI|nr:hypothetical protein FGIG_12032 [Fasciola gigantica]
MSQRRRNRRVRKIQVERRNWLHWPNKLAAVVRLLRALEDRVEPLDVVVEKKGGNIPSAVN